jgi:hypothetical protein
MRRTVTRLAALVTALAAGVAPTVAAASIGKQPTAALRSAPRALASRGSGSASAERLEGRLRPWLRRRPALRGRHRRTMLGRRHGDGTTAPSARAEGRRFVHRLMTHDATPDDIILAGWRGSSWRRSQHRHRPVRQWHCARATRWRAAMSTGGAGPLRGCRAALPCHAARLQSQSMAPAHRQLGTRSLHPLDVRSVPCRFSISSATPRSASPSDLRSSSRQWPSTASWRSWPSASASTCRLLYPRAPRGHAGASRLRPTARRLRRDVAAAPRPRRMTAQRPRRAPRDAQHRAGATSSCSR